MSFSSRDRETLAKLLALAGSTTHDGETIAAMKKADDLIRTRNTTWQDVLLVRPSASQLTPSTWKRPGEPGHVAQVMELLQRGKGTINAWERGFLLNILAYRELKPRQEEILTSILRKVAAATASAA
jgi:hypothetical protein